MDAQLSKHTNEYGQPVGPPLDGWTAPALPEAETLPGQFCTLERLTAQRHGADLFDAHAAAPDGRAWTYLPVGPFETRQTYLDWARTAEQATDPLHYAVVDNASGRALGTLSLMRQDPSNGVIEVGWVVFSPALQRTPMSTEAQFLLMRYAFDELGYRRYEWKCDSLNEPSRRAALRLGFTHEGTFRQAVVYKGRSRDTAWFSITDAEWPRIRTAFRAWLEPSNFDDNGFQHQPLGARG